MAIRLITVPKIGGGRLLFVPSQTPGYLDQSVAKPSCYFFFFKILKYCKCTEKQNQSAWVVQMVNI